MPFISAVAAGDVPDHIRVPLLALLGDISIGGSHIATCGSHSGALRRHVDALVTASLTISMARLSSIQIPKLVVLIEAIQSLLVQATDVRRDAVESAIDFALAPPATPWAAERTVEDPSPAQTCRQDGGMSCVFCSILLNDRPADWVARDEHAAAFLPLPRSSLAPGHTLVTPTAHISGVHEATLPSLGATMALVRRVSVAMRDVLGPTGVNLLSASGPGSEQAVAHLHFHVVPRWEGDGFTSWLRQRSTKVIVNSPTPMLVEVLR